MAWQGGFEGEGLKDKNAVDKLKTAVTDGIKNLPEKLRESGKNLVEGLWNGITGAGI